ncbi:MAG: ABC transporter permease [Bacteroidota bacterium]
MNIFKNNPIVRIAFVHLVSKKRQTVVAMLGVTFGIAVYIFQAGLITGLQQYMVDKMVNNTAHIHLYNDPERNPPSILSQISHSPNEWIVVRNQKQKDIQKKLRNSAQVMDILERMPEVAGVAPFLGTQAIVKAGFKEKPVTISGVNIDRENALFNLNKEMISGDLTRMKTLPNGIILGVGVAKKLGAIVDDIITISTVNTVLDMKVVGITQNGITAIDDNRAYVNLRSAQKLMNVDMLYITDINIKLKDVDQADQLADELERTLGFRAQSWKEANSGIFGVFKIQNIATYLVITSILIVAGFGIFNILMMMIYEKMTDIAILKSIGFRNGDIRTLFLIEAIVIGVIGGLAGLLMGYGMCRLASTVKIELKGLVSLDHLNINYDPIFYITGFAYALVSTALAGWFPAAKASKVDPIDIIRGK